jgi:hypothetical protein
MGLSRLIGALCAVFFLLLSTLSHASLIDRGGGLIYDDVLDITWLQDTNYALTSGANDGMMHWQEANDWAAGLSYYDTVRDVTYDDWRLPMLSPVNGISWDTTTTNDGSSDKGYASTTTTTDGMDGGWRDYSGTPVSELGYMFYVNLANLGKCDPAFTLGCHIQDGFNDQQYNTGLFTNFSHIVLPDFTELTVGNYATGTDFFDEITEGLNGDYAWNFGIDKGESQLRRKGAGFDRLAAWAVRDGDVSAVPVPAAVWLFGSGLLGLIGIARRKKAA